MKLNFSQLSIPRYQRAFCISVAMVFSIALAHFSKIDRGLWIPLTVLVVFTAPFQGLMLKKAFDRVAGTLIGLILGFLIVTAIPLPLIYWAYIIPLIWFIMFYVNNTTNNYFYLVILVSIFLVLFLSVMTPGGSASIGSAVFARFYCTLIGAVIALTAEYFIFKNAFSAKKPLSQSTFDLFDKFISIITTTTDYLTEDNKEIKGKYYKESLQTIGGVSIWRPGH